MSLVSRPRYGEPDIQPKINHAGHRPDARSSSINDPGAKHFRRARKHCGKCGKASQKTARLSHIFHNAGYCFTIPRQSMPTGSHLNFVGELSNRTGTLKTNT